MGKLRTTSASTSNGNSTGASPATTAAAAVPRIERKFIEKNRRNRMKDLYSNLISLLPDHSKLEGLPLPDQIDEAVAHIKTLKMKLDKYRLKKESLLRRKASDSCITSGQSTSKGMPLVELHNMGPNINVILVNGLEDFSKFHDIIRQANQNGDEIASASFTKYGNSTVQVLHDKAGKKSNLGNLEGAATSSSRKLKDEFVCGASSNSQIAESQLDVWDYEIESNIWGFEFGDASIARI